MSRYDQELKRLDDDRKKVDDEKKKVEDEAKRKVDEEARRKTEEDAKARVTIQPPVVGTLEVPPGTDPDKIFKRTTKPGVEVQITQHTNRDYNCTQGAFPKLDLVTPPRNGRVVFRTVPTKPTGCSKPVDGIGVFYVPNPGFIGTDNFKYDRSDTTTRNWRVAGGRYVTVEVRP